MYQSGFPVQSSRNLLRRSHNRIPEINAEHFVSKLVSVFLKYILPIGDDCLEAQIRKQWSDVSEVRWHRFLALVLMLIGYTYPQSLALCSSLANENIWN